MPIRVLIADDHGLLRQGIRDVLELEEDFAVIAEAGDGEETLRKTAELEPDILLLDINIPKINGLEVLKRVTASQPSIRVVVLTIQDDENYVLEVIKSGAAGYLLKDIEPGMLVKAIRTVYEGKSYVYPTLATRVFGEISRKAERKRATLRIYGNKREEHLTYREIEVLQLICQGMSNQEIAGKLFLSEKTVKNHLTNIFRKINVNDRTQAALYALKQKIVALD